MAVNVVSFKCRDLPIDKVVVFNDRAEIRRHVSAELPAGINEVHVKNVTQSLIDSIRVSGKGDAVIHEVVTGNDFSKSSEIDSPKISEVTARYDAKKVEVQELRDEVVFLEKCISALDKAATEGLTPTEGASDVVGNISKFYAFYQEQSKAAIDKLRNTKIAGTKKEKELEEIETELNNAKPITQCDSLFNEGNQSWQFGVQPKQRQTCVITVECNSDGPVELDLVYQVKGAKWTPSYDFRVDTAEEALMKVSYYGQISQSTYEDWKDATIVLSTAKPSLGAKLPVIGTIEASVYQRPQPVVVQQGTGLFANTSVRSTAVFGGAMSTSSSNSTSDQPVLFGSAPQPMTFAAATVEEQTLHAEFTIAKKTTVPSGKDSTKVLIGIAELKPQLLHECIPSKNTSVFLTANAVNESQLVFLQEAGSIYLNNSYIAKTQIKSVSPGERFSCSLGVDPSVKVLYKPARKYKEEVGMLSRLESEVTEQIIKVRNTRSTPITLTITEQIPRSTNDKIKVSVIHPARIQECNGEKTVKDKIVKEEGCELNAQHNLELTVKMEPGQVRDVLLKWAMEYPKDEKIVFNEKFEKF